MYTLSRTPYVAQPVEISNAEINASALTSGEIDRDHNDNDRQKLQDHPPAHKPLAPVGVAAAQHVPKAQSQDDRDCADGKWGYVGQRVVHSKKTLVHAA